jgi:hypothetical protein
MAKILYSALVDGIRGRTGGVIFSANAAGPLVRRYSPPIARSTSPQVGRRAVFSFMGSLWRALTQPQRDAWNTYAIQPAQGKTDSLGNPYDLNGFQWFVSCNCNLTLTGRPYVTAPPVPPVPTTPIMGTLTITAPGTAGNSQGINVASFTTRDMVLELNWTRNQSRQVAVEKNYLFTIGVQNAALVASIDLGNLQSKFGVIGVGTFWISRVYKQDQSGRRGTYVTATDVAS